MNYMKIFVFSFWCFLSFSLFGTSSLFPYTVKGKIPMETQVGQQYQLTYNIKTILPLRERFKVDFFATTSDFSLKNNCTKPLSANQSCEITITLRASQKGAQFASLTVYAGNILIVKKIIHTKIE